MKCVKCDVETVKGVIFGRSGMHWMPLEEYNKQGFKQLTRNPKSIVKIGRTEHGNQVIDDMHYCPSCEIVFGQMKATK